MIAFLPPGLTPLRKGGERRTRDANERAKRRVRRVGLRDKARWKRITAEYKSWTSFSWFSHQAPSLVTTKRQ